MISHPKRETGEMPTPTAQESQGSLPVAGLKIAKQKIATRDLAIAGLQNQTTI